MSPHLISTKMRAKLQQIALCIFNELDYKVLKVRDCLLLRWARQSIYDGVVNSAYIMSIPVVHNIYVVVMKLQTVS